MSPKNWKVNNIYNAFLEDMYIYIIIYILLYIWSLFAWINELRELVLGWKCLSKSPSGRNNVVKHKGFSINQRELERQFLVSQVDAALPIRTPIPMHRHPWCSASHPRPPYPGTLHGPAAADIRYHHHVKARLPLQRESDSSSSCTSHPLIHMHTQ